MQINKEWEQPNGKYKCKECGKEYSIKGISTHMWRAHGKGKNHNPNKGYNEGRVIWNKGLTSKTDIRIKERAEKLKERYKNKEIKPGFEGKKHSKETIEKISKALSKNNHGGKCKWYKVSGSYVQGTWERDLAKHMNLLGIEWEKIKTNSYTFQYEIDGKKKHYTPDFKIQEFGILLELKGYWWGNDKEKMKLVLEQNDLPNLFIIEKERYEKLLKTYSKEEFRKEVSFV